MEALKLAFFLGIGMVLISFYVIRTAQIALKKREEIIDEVRRILKDQKASKDFKIVVRGLFHASIVTTILPRVMLTPSSKGSDGTFSISKEEHKKLNELMMKFTVINFQAAPHYYILGGIIFLAYVILAVPFFLLKKKSFDLIEAYKKKFQGLDLVVAGRMR